MVTVELLLLCIALNLVGSSHAEQLVQVLRKEAARAQSADHDGADKYRQLLVRAMHKAALKFPEVAGSVAPALLELLGDGSEPAAADVMLFLRSALYNFTDLRDHIYTKLLESVPHIKVGKIARSALWLLAEFADSPDRAKAALDVLADVIPSPSNANEGKEEKEKEKKEEKQEAPRQLVTSDGTYASQSAFNLPTQAASPTAAGPALWQALKDGESFTAACACSALAKLALKLDSVRERTTALHLAAALLVHHKQNSAAGPALWQALKEGESFTAACACSALAKLALKLDSVRERTTALHLAAALLVHHKQNSAAGPALWQALKEGESFTAACACSALAKLALKLDSVRERTTALHLAAALLVHHKQNSGTNTQTGLTADDLEHASICLVAGSTRPEVISEALLGGSRSALQALLQLSDKQMPADMETWEEVAEVHAVEVETGIQFAALAGGGVATAVHDMFELSLNKALQGRSTGANEEKGRLSKVTQLTGFSDPVYAEAIVAVNQYDIVLDVLVVNQTDDTLQNCTVELATLGDLRLVERPAAVVLAPRDFATIKAHVKVASTENGIIFGNIVYEVTGASMDRGVVVLNDIHIDIVDYIQPALCSDAEFRQMWAEFEWENKVSVNTNITDLKEYLQHLLASTNMKCLTPDKALSGQCGFMAANLYARSIFGEDALANLSIETPLHKPNAPVVGHVRIRAKSQGMALSLGDKINLMHKAPAPAPAPQPPAAVPA
ncbi:hypothetical protein O0L34_g18440 [Tuta absoluta]|nr:hypothetical protein O0L34_g18440 [Tuta absoluta]